MNDTSNQSRSSYLKEKQYKLLIKGALDARKNSYSPYSNYQVGACLEDEMGGFFYGCNIENAAYGPTICAERVAIFKAISDGYRKLCAIAIVGGPKGDAVTDYAYPCGVCRQVMMEFADPETFEIIVAKSPEDYKVYLLKELLPMGFGPDNLA